MSLFENYSTVEPKFIVRHWRRIPFAPDYIIRDDGVVMSFKGRKPRKLKPWITPEGYLQYSLDGVKHYAHRVVMRTFHGEPPDPGLVTDHLDFDRVNNSIENLRWLPRLENLRRTPATANL